MQGLKKEILEAFAEKKCTVRFYMNAANKTMVAMLVDQLDDVVMSVQGPDKHIALSNLHAAWSKPAAKPESKKKTSKKKSAPKTAPIEADAPDADGGDDDG